MGLPPPAVGSAIFHQFRDLIGSSYSQLQPHDAVAAELAEQGVSVGAGLKNPPVVKKETIAGGTGQVLVVNGIYGELYAAKAVAAPTIKKAVGIQTRYRDVATVDTVGTACPNRYRSPVNAIDNALRSGLERFYPELSKLELTDYKVRILQGLS